MATSASRIKNIFKTTSLNKAGIVVAVVFVKGIPTIVAVDDYLPYFDPVDLAFAQIPHDNAVWGPLIEKVFAKVMVNYETIIAGDPVETFDFFLGTPVKQYMMESTEIGYDSNDLSTLDIAIANVWDIVHGALSTERVVECGAGSSTIDSLVTNHAYSVLGAWNISDETGSYNLFKIRNPWGVDATYNGTWADESPSWTQSLMSQVPYVNDLFDGDFFISDIEFVEAFADF